MAQISLAFLGAFAVYRDDQSVTDFRSAKARALLAYLAIEMCPAMGGRGASRGARPHQRAYLAGLLWPEWPEATARTYLRQALNNLQQILGDKESLAPLILATPTTLQFNP